MPTIDRRLRDLEDRLRPDAPEAVQREIEDAFVRALIEGPRADRDALDELRERIGYDREQRPRPFPHRYYPLISLSDEDLDKRCEAVTERIEVELVRQGYSVPDA